MANRSIRFMNISQMSVMFDLSRDTVRKRLRSAGLKAVRHDRLVPLYDMKFAGPALFVSRSLKKDRSDG